MLYPDTNMEIWCKRWNISPAKKVCPVCGKDVVTTMPFTTNKYVGLISEHSCKGGNHSVFKLRDKSKRSEILLRFHEIREVLRDGV